MTVSFVSASVVFTVSEGLDEQPVIKSKVSKIMIAFFIEFLVCYFLLTDFVMKMHNKVYIIINNRKKQYVFEKHSFYGRNSIKVGKWFLLDNGFRSVL